MTDLRFTRLTPLVVALACAGCTTLPACDRACVSAKIADRAGYWLGPPPVCGQLVLPNGARLDDGLCEDEAVLIALWNNAAFQELVADLGIAHGDLVQADLLPNPEVVYLFRVPEKAYRYAVDFPLEALWLRPIRVAAAGREANRVCERLAQSALDLIRDVRQAYADVLLAHRRLGVADDAVRIRGEIARFAEARLAAGDISEQEAATARIDSLTAQQDRARVGYDVRLAEERLRNLLGVGDDRTPLRLDDTAPPVRADLDAEELTAQAVVSRPDALAAEQAAAAAVERLRLSKLVWFRFLGIADATAGMRTGHEFGPAFRSTLPIFNWNQGAVARAEAEFDRAERQRVTVRNQIVLDVHQAHHRYTQARAERDILVGKVQPEVEAGIRRAEAGYREGNTPYVVVLETTRQLLDSRLRLAILDADLRRAWADLERSVGQRLDAPPEKPSSLPSAEAPERKAP